MAVVGKRSGAVWSDKVLKPVAARFGWAGRPYLNLQIESGLPAGIDDSRRGKVYSWESSSPCSHPG
jgi:hypothetical protein